MFAVLRKQSLIGDAVSHCTLPGIALAFLITNSKILKFYCLELSCPVSWVYLITTITKYSKLKFDTSLALVLSVLFGIGVVFLTYIQKCRLSSSRIGKIYFRSSFFPSQKRRLSYDWKYKVLFLMHFPWKEFKLVSFDPTFAHTIGISERFFGGFLSLLIVLGIVIGL